MTRRKAIVVGCAAIALAAILFFLLLSNGGREGRTELGGRAIEKKKAAAAAAANSTTPLSTKRQKRKSSTSGSSSSTTCCCTLIIDVGPGKMGTTHLQSVFSTIGEFLEQDSFIYLGTNRIHPVESVASARDAGIVHRKHLFSRGSKGRLRLSKPFQARLDHLRDQQQNGILISEHLSGMTLEEAQTLQSSTQGFKIEIIVTYRRLYRYLPSRYNQRIHPSQPGNKHVRHWPPPPPPPAAAAAHHYASSTSSSSYHIKPFDITTRNYYGSKLFEANGNGSHPTARAMERFQPFFNVTIVSLDTDLLSAAAADDPYVLYMVCHVLSLPRTCQAVEQGRIPARRSDDKSNPSFPINYDIIAVAAYEAGLYKSPIDRATAVRHIERYHNHHQSFCCSWRFPAEMLICPTPETQARFLNASLQSEVSVYGPERAAQLEPDHRAGFASDVASGRLCHVNGSKVIQDKDWRAFLSSLRAHTPLPPAAAAADD